MVGVINMITTTMNKTYPDFCFNGKLLAQGEDIEDRWELIINDEGLAEKKEVAVTGDKIECPHCGEGFIYDGGN